MKKLLNKIVKLIFLVSVLLISCQSDENQDENEIINLIQSTLIKPIIYSNLIEKNKIHLSPAAQSLPTLSNDVTNEFWKYSNYDE